MTLSFGNKKGVTLVELMIAGALLVVASLAFMSSFNAIARAIRHSKIQSLSVVPLAVQKMEALKQLPYTRLIVTTTAVQALEAGLDPFSYDVGAYPPETIAAGGIEYFRRVYVERVAADSLNLSTVAYTSADTGAKRITVYIVWREDRRWRMYSLSSLYTNPDVAEADSALNGFVTYNSIMPLAGARVEVVQNAALSAVTNYLGYYSLKAPAGSYTVKVSSNGYFTQYSPVITLTPDNSTSKSFNLSAMSYGSVTGDVWLARGPVISMVVANYAGYEAVELYNPTTAPFIMNSATLKLLYQKSGGSLTTVPLTFRTSAIPAQGYYLIANANTIYYGFTGITADAVFGYSDLIDKSKGGGLGIQNPATSEYYDRVAWRKNYGVGGEAPAALTEGTPYTVSGGLGSGQLFRQIYPGYIGSSYGRSYDSGNNSLNLYYTSYIGYPLNNSSDIQTPLSGVPAYGAAVSANDGMSPSAQAGLAYVSGIYPKATFTLTPVATGTWNVSFSSGDNFAMVSSVMVSARTTVYVPNSYTSPPWQYGGVYSTLLTSTTENGFISGTVHNVYDLPLAGIAVTAGEVTALTDAAGQYLFTVPAGTVTVMVNPEGLENYNNYYASVSSQSVVVAAGQIVKDVDFTITAVGSVAGRVTSNGVDGLGNVPVTAESGGIESGYALTDADGYFSMPNLSSGVYTVAPQLDSSERASPSSVLLNVYEPGETVWSATFTVANTMCGVKGTVTENGLAVPNGALIFISSVALSGSSLPVNNAALRAGGVVYYSDSTQPDGTYSIPVRGSDSDVTYYVYAFRNGQVRQKTVAMREAQILTADFAF